MIKPMQGAFKVLFVFTIALELIRLLSPYVLKVIIDKLTTFQKEDFVLLLGLIGLFFLSEEVISLVSYFRNKLVFATYFRSESYFHILAQKKLVNLSLGYHEKENTGNKISKVQRGIQQILDLLGNLAWDFIPIIIQLIVTFVVLMFIDWRIGVSILFFAPLFIYVTYRTNIAIYPIRKERYKAGEDAAGKMCETMVNINAVQSFSQEKREIQGYREIRERIKDQGILEWFSLLKNILARDAIIDSGRVVCLLLSVYLVWIGDVSLGTLVFVITLSEKTYISLYRISRLYDRIEEAKVAYGRLDKIFKAKSEIVNPKNGIQPKKIEGAIKFENVSFKYQQGKASALNNVDLKISSGCVTALVGPSGGGKTTTVKLIYRHYDPQKGRVLLDGKDLKKYDMAGFRKHLAIVPQEVEIFDASIYDNIAYANPDANRQEVESAARIANAHEFIEKLPQKYNTEVGERGVRLSGGQRQRVGIARAILANPRILIFDEATSNLDSYSEKLIQEAIDKIRKNRTMIIIAHRLSTIKKADKIIVLEDGKAVEQGSHTELSGKKGGLYAKLHKLQQMGDVV